jgi:LmbE family N-acetylglucosaminyl deacetylase
MKTGLSGVLAVLLFCFSAGAAGIPEGALLEGLEPGPDGKIDVLTVFAHQDDESGAGGTLLKMKKDPRVRVYLLCMTFDQTSPAKDNLGVTPDHIGRIRVKELEVAGAVYQADEVIQLMYHGRTLPHVDQEELIESIRQVIDRVGAEVVITFDPQGITGHQDHQALSKAATEAFNRSGAKRLYYKTMPKWAYDIAIAVTPYPNPAQPVYPTLKVNIKPERKLKKMATLAHVSQMQFSSIGVWTKLSFYQSHEYFARVK